MSLATIGASLLAATGLLAVEPSRSARARPKRIIRRTGVGSIAGVVHQHKRANARRLRQLAKLGGGA